MSVSMTLPQLRRHECSVDGRTVHLQPALAEFLALLLVRGPSRYLTARELIEALWPDADLEPETALDVVRVYASSLRRLGITVECRRVFGYCIPLQARAEYEQPDQRLAA